MDAILFATSLGLFAGLSPGPLMTVVLSAAVERGFRAGLLTAIAPLLTDAPVILLSLMVLGRVPEEFLSGVTIVGALFVGWIGVRTLLDARHPPSAEAPVEAGSRDVWRGAMVNLLSPHPWIFWFTVGTPFMVERWREARWEAIAFLAVFLGLLVGFKVAIAYAAARGRRFLDAGWYRLVLMACGVFLIGFAARMLWQGVSALSLS